MIPFVNEFPQQSSHLTIHPTDVNIFKIKKQCKPNAEVKSRLNYAKVQPVLQELKKQKKVYVIILDFSH